MAQVLNLPSGSLVGVFLPAYISKGRPHAQALSANCVDAWFAKRCPYVYFILNEPEGTMNRIGSTTMQAKSPR